jgi:hypothetical protein
MWASLSASCTHHCVPRIGWFQRQPGTPLFLAGCSRGITRANKTVGPSVPRMITGTRTTSLASRMCSSFGIANWEAEPVWIILFFSFPSSPFLSTYGSCNDSGRTFFGRSLERPQVTHRHSGHIQFDLCRAPPRCQLEEQELLLTN